MKENYKILKLPELATWERAKKGKIYPAGCTLLQVSATDGQAEFLSVPQEIESRYCVIIPDESRANPRYLFYLLQMGMEEFLSREQTGINIRPEILKRFPVPFYESKKIQEQIVEVQEFYESRIRETEKKIESLKGMKAFFIDNLLV